MFPIAIRRKRNDDFGELIRPEDFLRAEERDEVDGQDLRHQPNKFDTKDTLGKKRKWDDIAVPGDRRLSNGGNKRQQIRQAGSPELGDLVPGVDDYEVFDDDVDEVTDPSRVIFSTETFSVNLRLAFVDFAGLHDKRSLQMLIPLIQPRKLIFVSGMKDETLNLASDCRKLLAANIGGVEESAVDVYTPEVGVRVNASVDTNAWAVKLTDALVKRLRWQNVKGLGIVTLTGRLEASALQTPEMDEGIIKEQKMIKGEAEPVHDAVAEPSQVEPPTLDVLPSSMASATRSVAQPLHVGDLRLADLRKIMQASGHTAEFKGEGTLLIDASVIVRKTGTGRIEIEGTGILGMPQQESTFYAVKSKIYEGLAVVAGG
ncbi:hypothetical protein G7Y89_g6730 [Cudoniella acicularis]|uniref:Cleavage and polyadenylation specificity factor subunit 2 n=1 Tax=Cudoniella acicularis TaxID=354080 RepID=A0A8H4W2R2_9HELO|nr:hypothetical protein G7Y89_g6730 [Cudoniella acicularis]